MGVLGNQSPRKDFKFDLIGEIDFLKGIAKKTGLSLDQVIKVQANCLMSQRNSLYQENGDYFDEQMAGIGQKLEDIARASQPDLS